MVYISPYTIGWAAVAALVAVLVAFVKPCKAFLRLALWIKCSPTWLTHIAIRTIKKISKRDVAFMPFLSIIENFFVGLKPCGR